MQHSDPDVLALVALGEQPAPTDAEHLRGCRQCRDEVAAFARVVQGVRVDADPDDVPPVAPPPRVWDAIAAGTGVSAAPRPDKVVGQSAPRTLGIVPARPRGARRNRSHGDRNRLLLAVAASLVVGAVAGGLGASLFGGRDATPPVATPTTTSTTTSPAPQVIAQVDLANLKRTPATGHAVLFETAGGPRIKVDTSKLALPPGSFYEVWLIDRQIKKMVSIGTLRPGEDEFAVPNGVDVSQYPILDISVQQPGDPKHSGDSVLRGTIPG